MKEAELKLGNEIQSDRVTVYEQMKNMKSTIGNVSRLTYNTADAKEDFDAFKQDLLKRCDQFVEDQRKKMDDKFSSI